MGRKILGWIVLIVLLAGSVCAVVFGIKYNNLKSTDKGELSQTIDNLQFENANLNSQINALNTEIASLESEILILERENQQKTEQISEFETLITELESDNTNKETEINDLKNQISQLQTQIDENNTKILDLENIKTTLENEKIELQNEITRLNSLMENYVVSFSPTEEEYALYVDTYPVSSGLILDHIRTEYYPALKKLNIVSKSLSSSQDEGVLYRYTYLETEIIPSTFGEVLELISDDTIFTQIVYEEVYNSSLCVWDSIASTETTLLIKQAKTTETVSVRGLAFVKDASANIIDVFEIVSRKVAYTSETDIDALKNTLSQELYEYTTNRIELYD